MNMHQNDDWASEFEDSPRSNDDIGSMFSESPNHAMMVARKPHGHPMPPVPMGMADRHFQDVPIQMVPEAAVMTHNRGAIQAKRLLVRRIQQDSMRMLSMTSQAVMVRGPTGNYNVYHLEITSDYYKQKWVVCKRYSEFYRLRKRLLARFANHKKVHGCQNCGRVGSQLKDFGFPKRVEIFRDKSALVAKRTSGLEEFIVALCQYIGGDDDFEVCAEINSCRFMVKEFLQFPLEHECQHVRAIRNLKYVDPRDVYVDTESCPICLSEWRELDGNQLVLSPCGHFFHESCINEWYRTRFDCPMCRSIAGLEADANSTY
ncbi:hypothetical protein P43SY_006735 [Pythium insidiosum]|uniref:RING-type domain-containing protein n=1 Tax=Pythium insidiosum TaxID=114742 RepID=A0AAD5M989_PYTIN|nr:hypothetical protein P43SY_006735 [Pythium insidiosum]